MAKDCKVFALRLAVPTSMIVAAAYAFRQFTRWQVNRAAREVWRTLTVVERTAVDVCLFRCNMPSLISSKNKYWNPDYDQAMVSYCMPFEEQEKLKNRMGSWADVVVAVRTSEIDVQAMETVMGSSEIRQVVILGAGLDPRAWRLAWPEGTKVFEVDTGSVEKLKAQVLGPLKMTASSRTFLQADLSKALTPGFQLAEKLKMAGFDVTKQCLWIAEGLIGYIAAEEGGNLIKAMYQACAPGSKMIMTCPPSLKQKEDSVAAGYPLYHTTFEEEENLLERVRAQGWMAQLNTGASIGKRFGFEEYNQGQVIGLKS